MGGSFDLGLNTEDLFLNLRVFGARQEIQVVRAVFDRAQRLTKIVDERLQEVVGSFCR